MKQGKEQPEQRIYFVPRAMRKTVGLSYGEFKGKGTKQLYISIAPIEKL